MKNIFDKKIEKPKKECSMCLDYGQVIDRDPHTGRKILLPCPKCSVSEEEVQEAVEEVVNTFTATSKSAQTLLEEGCPMPYEVPEPKQVKDGASTKLPLHYILKDMAHGIYMMGKVMQEGAKKYPKRKGWLDVPSDEIDGAIDRHTNAYHRGEILDPETGLPHLIHIAVNCMMNYEKTLGNVDG